MNNVISISPVTNGKRIAVTLKYRPVGAGKIKAILLDENGLRVNAHIMTCEATDKAVLKALELEAAKPVKVKEAPTAPEGNVPDGGATPPTTPVEGDSSNASVSGDASNDASKPKAPKADTPKSEAAKAKKGNGGKK
jgi:hypothetical protein